MSGSLPVQEATMDAPSPKIGSGLWFKLYDFLLPAGIFVARVAALVHPKLATALRGRIGGVSGWRIGPRDGRPVLLVHTASRGEFEGAQPLLESLLERGLCKVAVSFSSPSVADAVLAMDGIWACGYLPFDRRADQRRLFETLSPSALVVFKHDFWPNMIRVGSQMNIPVILANANFHPGSRRDLPAVRSFHRDFMKGISAAWVVSEEDAARAAKYLSPSTSLAVLGDTRYDRVRRRAEAGRSRFRELGRAMGGRLLIIGSSWPTEERMAYQSFQTLRAAYPDLKMIVAPHEPTTAAIKRNRDLAAQFGLNLSLYSEWGGESLGGEVLIIDKVGILADLYSIGWAALIGGGFGAGVHSVIEPAAYGIPVAFGPKHYVSHEAGLLAASSGGAVVKNADDLTGLWGKWLENPEEYSRAAHAADGVVRAREGATKRLLAALEPHLLGSR